MPYHVQGSSSIRAAGSTIVKIRRNAEYIPWAMFSTLRTSDASNAKQESTQPRRPKTRLSQWDYYQWVAVNRLESYHSSHVQNLLVNSPWFYHLYKKLSKYGTTLYKSSSERLWSSLQKVVFISRPLRICSPFRFCEFFGSAIAHIHVQSEARQIVGAIRFATDGCRTT